MSSDKSTPERQLARFAALTTFSEIPDWVLHEAKRSLVNIFATALAGSREPAVEISLRTHQPWSGPPACSLAGRSERVDAPLAAFINAMSANIFDFDDTHEATIIHPASILFGALFAQAETIPVTGRDLLRAFVIGGEIECRIGNAVTPWHYERGWHITSTCGVFGTATAVGVLMDLDANRMLHALSIAAVQSGGLVEALGTMAKSVSVGNAARGGLISAALAAEGFQGPAEPLLGARGWLKVHADQPRPEALTSGLGEHWEIALNTYKPYPVGVVLNPVLDACIALRERTRIALADIASIELTGHPLLRQRTDRPDISSGRQSQVSAQHAVAVAFLCGRAGLDEFDDDAVAETARAGRPPITFVDEEARDIAGVHLVVRTHDGREHVEEIEAARGSRGRPLSDDELVEKLVTLARRIGIAAPAALIDAIWSLDKADDAGALMRLARA